MLLQLQMNCMVMIQLVLETSLIYLGLCLSINKMGILKKSLMAENLLEKITIGNSQKFYKPIDFNSLTNAKDEIKVAMIFLWLHFFCEQVVNKLKGTELFPDQINRNHLDLVVVRCIWNNCTMESLRYSFYWISIILRKSSGIARTFSKEIRNTIRKSYN